LTFVRASEWEKTDTLLRYIHNTIYVKSKREIEAVIYFEIHELNRLCISKAERNIIDVAMSPSKCAFLKEYIGIDV